MHTTTTATTAAAILALLALAGCSRASTTAAAPTSTADAPPTSAPTTPTIAAPTTTTDVAPTATSAHRTCGVDLTSPAIAAAVAQVRPAFADRPERTWSTTPYASNYDPCATLSAALILLKDGTGSSPEQVLMFHDGVYQGTGTFNAYGFTDLDVAASTNDTVVVHYGYEKPGETTASASGGVTVRYQWSGGAVHMLDPLPAVITGH
jgi:hypothetical protein